MIETSCPICHTAAAARCLRCAAPMCCTHLHFGHYRCRDCEREYLAWPARRVLKVSLVAIAIAFGLAVGFTGGMVAALALALLAPWKAIGIVAAFAAYLTIQVGSITLAYRVAAGVSDALSRAAFLQQKQPAVPVARARLRP